MSIFDFFRRRKLTTGKAAPEVKPEWVPGQTGFFPVRVRVWVNDRSGFSRNNPGIVTRWDPDGKIWVERDGAESSAYFFAHELDYEVGVFTQPEECRVTGHDAYHWWIAIGPRDVDEMIDWARDSLEHPCTMLCDEYDGSLHQSIAAGFTTREDAMLFYLRFK